MMAENKKSAGKKELQYRLARCDTHYLLGQTRGKVGGRLQHRQRAVQKCSIIWKTTDIMLVQQ